MPDFKAASLRVNEAANRESIPVKDLKLIEEEELSFGIVKTCFYGTMGGRAKAVVVEQAWILN